MIGSFRGTEAKDWRGKFQIFVAGLSMVAPTLGSAAAPPSACRPVSPASGWANGMSHAELEPAILGVCAHFLASVTAPRPMPQSGAPPAQPDPGQPSFLSLDEAAQLLKSSPAPLPDSERRYLVTLIARSGIENPSFDAILPALGVGDSCRSELAALARAMTPSSVAAEERFVESVNALLVDPESPDAIRCRTSGTHVRVERIPGSEGATATLSDSVWVKDGGLDRLRRAVDPYAWKRCNAESFMESCRIAEEPACRTLTSCNRQDPVLCRQPSRCDPECGSPPTIGQWDGDLFEHYRFAIAPGVTSEFRNVLRVDWEPEGRPDGYEYDLVQSISHHLAGDVSAQTGCGISMDEGHVELARASDGWFRFSSSKTIEFCGTSNDSFLNRFAPVYLCAMGASVGRNLCCEH